MGTVQRFMIVLPAMLLLAACDTWFGKAEDPPLPGERLSVLLHERNLVPDPELADSEIKLPPPSPTDDWPQAGGYANHAMHHLEINESISRAWRSDVGTGSDSTDRIIAPPIVAEGLVFTMDAETTVSAFALDTGREKWANDLTPDDEDDGHIGGGLAYEGGKVFVATGFGQVIALASATGEELWRVDLKGPIRSAPTARGGRVFVISVDNKLTTLNGATGETLWTYSSISEVASLLGGASPAVDSGVVVAPFSSGEISALRVENGRVLWTDALGAYRRTDVVSTLSHIRGRPVIDRGVVYAVSNGGVMAAIDLRTGRRMWDKDIGGIESPWVAGDYVYVLTNESEAVCLSRESGKIFWITTLQRFEDEEDRTDPIIWTGPVLASDRLIIAGSQGRAVTLSPYTGELLGYEELPSGVESAPAVASRSVLFLSSDGSLSVYR